MKRRTFTVYSDPGHAWVKVPKAFLCQIIGADWRKVFSSFSYERGDNVYLEEDEDACRFLHWCHKSDIEPVFKHALSKGERYSRIRNYAQLSPC